MFTCTKTYSDLAAGHRQPHHDGHCRFVHGHNYGVVIVFATASLDENGFVVDFGKLKYIKEYLENMLDHTLLIAQDDPALETFKSMHTNGLCDLRIVTGTSAEMLAAVFAREINDLVNKATKSRVFIQTLTVIEDSKNTATYIR